MASSINASTTAGLVNTADTSGVLNIQTAGTTAIAIDASQNVTYTTTTIASYVWTSWNPTNVTGTVTNAPSTGTTDDSNYVTMVNASGTLTITFDIAGKYFVCISQQTAHGQVYTVDRQTANLGGTATRRIIYNPTNSGVDSNDQNFSISTGFYVSATATQTLTILPTYELTGGAPAASHIAACNVTIQYCGG